MTEAEEMPRVEQWEAGERTAAPILRVRDLCKRFGGLLAISSLSFDVREGSITAVIGPNGAGKTTIFNLISGLHKPDGGSIFFRDKRIDLMRPHEVPSLGIARTFQNLSLFTNMTVLENVMAGRYTLSSSGLFTCALGTSRYRKEEKRIREKAREWLAFMGIEGLAGRKVTEVPFAVARPQLKDLARAWHQAHKVDPVGLVISFVLAFGYYLAVGVAWALYRAIRRKAPAPPPPAGA